MTSNQKQIYKNVKCKRLMNILTYHPLVVGFLIRLILMVCLPLLLDDGLMVKGVKYTDIDYDVFTDAAAHISEGRSPYERHTYRYTPFLAYILSLPMKLGKDGKVMNANYAEAGYYQILITWWKDSRYFGRLLFCLADTLCGYIILRLRRLTRKVGKKSDDKEMIPVELRDALWFMYNPLSINISTRGSAESFMVLLPVLGAITIAEWSGNSINNICHSNLMFYKREVMFRASLTGILLGVATHAKLYPIIYAASFMANFSFQEHCVLLSSAKNGSSTIGKRENSNVAIENWGAHLKPNNERKKNTESSAALYPFPWLNPRRLFQLIKLWMYRLFMSPASMTFLLFFLATFFSLTYLAVYIYGYQAMEEGITYHFSRVDHRHNYSMYWYGIYLALGRSSTLPDISFSSSLPGLGRALLLPQAVILVYISLGLAPYDLTFALFAQTFLFVSQNKVITGQYFTWYLCILPLCSERITWKEREMVLAIGLLGLSVITWLGNAFALEMLGMSVHIHLWLASIFFFIANLLFFRAIIKNYNGSSNSNAYFKLRNVKKAQ